MKKFFSHLISLLLLCLLPMTARAVVGVQVQPVTAITATGGGTDVDISRFTRNGAFGLQSLNTAGTTPTLAAKLQTASLLGVGYTQTSAGTTVNKLRAAATTTNKLAAVFTQSATAASLKTVTLSLAKIGTITAGTTIQVDIFATAAGVPTGSSLGTSSTILTDNVVATTYTPTVFTFPAPVDVTASTVYAIVLSGSYTASTSNYVSWRSLTVASGGNQATFDATTWTAIATETFEVFVSRQYSAFADVTGGGFTGATTGASALSPVYLYLDDLSQFVRIYYTIGGTSSPNYYVSSTLWGGYKGGTQ